MLALSATEYSSLGYDELLEAIETANGLEIQINEAVTPDCLRTCLVLASLAAQQKRLRITFRSKVLSRALVRSLHESLLAPLVWKDNLLTSCEVEASGLVTDGLKTVNKEHRYFVAHTSHLRATKPDAFQADLVIQLRDAGIVLPGAFLAALTTIGFEAHSNAEEYGYRSFTESDLVPFRVITAIVHENHEGIAPLAQRYFEAYTQSGHSLATRWLELLVVDAGVGLAYPRYARLAAASGWDNEDLYARGHSAELTMLRIVLEKAGTTKGQWGRVINRHTMPGQGLGQIKRRLSLARACAIVRAGRSMAHWYNPQLELEKIGRGDLSPYEPSERMHAFFRGTAWQFLLPLDPQIAMAL